MGLLWGPSDLTWNPLELLWDVTEDRIVAGVNFEQVGKCRPLGSGGSGRLLSSGTRQLGSHVFHSEASLVGVAAAGANPMAVMD